MIDNEGTRIVTIEKNELQDFWSTEVRSHRKFSDKNCMSPLTVSLTVTVRASKYPDI